MDQAVSAFQMYQKQNKRKRKAPPEPKKKTGLASKKPKKIHKEEKLSKKKDLTKLTRKQKGKTVSKKPEMITNGHESSDEEIPMLVPIPTLKSNKAIQSKKEKNQVTAATRGGNVGNSKKKISKIAKLTPEDNLSDCNEVQIFNPVMQGLAIFKWLIDPKSPKEFFETYWETEVLHVERSDRKYFADVFSSEKLDSILREYPLHFTRNIDVVAYQDGKKEVMDEEGK